MVGVFPSRTCQLKGDQIGKHWNTYSMWVADFPSMKLFKEQARDTLIRN